MGKTMPYVILAKILEGKLPFCFCITYSYNADLQNYVRRVSKVPRIELIPSSGFFMPPLFGVNPEHVCFSYLCCTVYTSDPGVLTFPWYITTSQCTLNAVSPEWIVPGYLLCGTCILTVEWKCYVMVDLVFFSLDAVWIDQQKVHHSQHSLFSSYTYTHSQSNHSQSRSKWAWHQAC